MKKKVLIYIVFLLIPALSFAGGYEIGDKASDFKLKNVDGNYISLSDYPEAEGVVVVFTCNHCPYAQAWEQRIIDLHNDYAKKGYPVIAINPNDESIVPGDSYANMVKRAKEKNYPFPYLKDDEQEVYPKYGATHTPHFYLLDKKNDDFFVKYIGAIDNNYKDASAVTETYLRDAIDAVIDGKKPDPQTTKALGCTIKKK
ncbi:MAG: thioredoxin family protein [Bacteroidota bacterium]